VAALAALPVSLDLPSSRTQANPLQIEVTVLRRYACDTADRSVYTEVALLAVKYVNVGKSSIAIRLRAPSVYRTRVAKDEVALEKQQVEYDVMESGPVVLPLEKRSSAATIVMSGKSSTGQLEGSAIVRRLDVPELQALIGVGGHVMQLDFFVEVAPVTGSNHIGRYEFVVLRTDPFPFVITQSPRKVRCS